MRLRNAIRTLVICGAIAIALLPGRALAQGSIVSGQAVTGSVVPGGATTAWTFSANAGDAFVVGIGELSPVGTFAPRIAVYNPSNTFVTSGSGSVAARVAGVASASGTYTILVDDSSIGQNVSGSYQLTLALSGHAPVVPGGDEGGTITNGVRNTGNISTGDIDVWSVHANAGDALIARVGESVAASALAPGVGLYSPSGASLGFNSGSAAGEVSATAPLTGDYMVIVCDNNVGVGGTGGYQLTVARSGAPVSTSTGDDGGAMTNGVMHTGTVDVGDLDLWTVDAIAGDAIVARIGETVAGASLAPGLRIYSPTGAQLDVNSGTVAAEVAINATVTGQYLIVVGDNNVGIGGSGGYRLSLARSGAPITTSAGDEGGAMTNGVMHTGNIDVGDLDMWTVDAIAGDAIIARIGETVAGATIAPGLRIYSPTGVQLDVNSGSAAAEVAINATVTGQYLIVVGDNNVGIGGIGAYRLTLAHTGAAVATSAGDEGGAMTNGVMHTGTIDVGDLDVWTVDALAGDVLIARAGETVAGATLAPGLRIYSPTGSLLSTNSGSAAAEVATNAPINGQYLIVAGDNNVGIGGAGGYRLTVVRSGAAVTTSGGDEGGAATNGAMHIGTISVGDLDVWTVNLIAGDAIIARIGETVAGSGLSPALRIYTPTGVLVNTGSGASAAEASGRATVSGQYLIVAGDNNVGIGGSGGYRLSIVRTGDLVNVTSGDEGGAMTNGVMHTGTIDTGDLDAWTVDAIAGDAIVVRVGETVASSALSPGVRIYSPAGVLLSSNSGSAACEAAASAPLTGQYVVIVGDNNVGIGGAGAYRVTLARSGAAVVTSLGDEGGPLTALSGGTIDVGDLDLWTISAVAGQPLVAAMEEIVIGSSLSPALRLYSPSGALLASNAGASRAQVNATATLTGTYLLIAGDNTVGIGGSGAYRLAPSYTTGTDDAPRVFTLAFAAPAPNPVVSRSVLRYSLPSVGRAQLHVYDAQGRMVRALVNESSQPAGDYAVEWDARSDAGERLAPGVYLARLQAAGRSLVQKVLIAR